MIDKDTLGMRDPRESTLISSREFFRADPPYVDVSPSVSRTRRASGTRINHEDLFDAALPRLASRRLMQMPGISRGSGSFCFYCVP